jgi:DNA primase
MKLIHSTNDYDRYLCPFHDDREPSLVVSKRGPFAGMWRCFGCGKHGIVEELGLVVEAKPQPRKQQVWDVLQKACVNWGEDLDAVNPNPLSKEWHVRLEILRQLGYGWDGAAHTFPMYNENGIIIGILRRFANGRKVCVEGSQLGLFAPNLCRPEHTLLITEGVSDCAVALEIGFLAIGRPSATAGEKLIVKWLNKQWPKTYNIIIVADNDKAGLKGANDLYQTLVKVGWNCDVFVPPVGKDLREFTNKGGKQTVANCLGEII